MPNVRVPFVSVALAVLLIAAPSWARAQQPGDVGTVARQDSEAIAAAAETSRAPIMAPGVPARRPRALPALYASFGAFQVLDAATTIRALDRGAVEANPVVGAIASNRGALMAVKAASFASTVYLTERLWKKNRLAAVVTMVAANSAYAVIVAHNYRAGSRLP